MIDELLDYVADEYEQLDLTLDNTIVFTIINPKDHLLEWIRENPPDSILKVRYVKNNSGFDHKLVLCAWRDVNKILTFKLTFSNRSKHVDKRDGCDSTTLFAFFKEIKKDYKRDNNIFFIEEYRNKK